MIIILWMARGGGELGGLAPFPSGPLLSSLFPHYVSWWEVDLGTDVSVKNVKKFYYVNYNHLCGAKVSLIDNAGKYQETKIIGDATNSIEIDIPFGLSETATSTWKTSPSPTGAPLLADEIKTQL
jgi:hypothetical protein